MGSIACINTSEPGGFVFQYQISVFGCDTDCSGPGAAPVTGAARGDTVWLRHDIVLLQATDTTRNATLRPDCARNVLVEFGSTAFDTIPTPTCPDSLALRSFVLGTGITRFNQWVVDSSLTPRTYTVVGLVLVQPRIEPRFGFTIQ